LTAPATLTLGVHPTLVHHLTGDIAEVKIYDAALSDAERVAEENAMACKYGLGAGALPSTPVDFSGYPDNRDIRLSWAPVVGASGYKLSWSRSSSGPFTQVSGNLTSTEYVDGSAVNGQINFYKLASFSPCGVSAYSDTLPVFLPLPVLRASIDQDNLVLTWPDWAVDWVLSSATNLSPPVTWYSVTNIPGTTNGEFILTLPMGAHQEYFRLGSS
jgi:hypothetical protein